MKRVLLSLLVIIGFLSFFAHAQEEPWWGDDEEIEKLEECYEPCRTFIAECAGECDAREAACYGNNSAKNTKCMDYCAKDSCWAVCRKNYYSSKETCTENYQSCLKTCDPEKEGYNACRRACLDVSSDCHDDVNSTRASCLKGCGVDTCNDDCWDVYIDANGICANESIECQTICAGPWQQCEWDCWKNAWAEVDFEFCDNKKDDDSDGKIDCEDAYCAQDECCLSGGCGEICDDEKDNDGDGKIDCDDEDCQTLSGKVYYEFGGIEHSVGSALVNISWGAQEMLTYTNERGEYGIEHYSLCGSDVVVTASLKSQSGLRVMNALNGQNYGVSASVTLEKAEDFVQNLAFENSDARNAAVIFEDTLRARKFFEGVLGGHVSQPVLSVWMHDNDCTCWSPLQDGGVAIFIKNGDESITSTEAPMNREFHEFGHHAMYEMYGGSMVDTVGTNHGGRKNPNTQDSWLEAWAEFFSMMCADYYEDDIPYMYPVGNSMVNVEINYKIGWGKGSVHEEMAVAGILWDLYDEKGEVGGTDDIQLSRAQIYGVLSSNRIDDVVELYESLNSSSLPQIHEKAENGRTKLDNIFIAHGAYADLNDNSKFDESEPMGYTVAKNGSLRRNMPPLEGSYIRAEVKDEEGNSVSVYDATVRVTFEPPYDVYNYEYETTVEGDRIYLEMPPEEYGGKATIVASGEEYKESAPVEITSASYYENWDESKEYFEETEITVERKEGTETNESKDGDEEKEEKKGGICGLPLAVIAFAGFAWSKVKK
ncbi:MAG: hypothetical protein ABIH99_01545 [Candidatus Micrarchaeota archaeon]